MNIGFLSADVKRTFPNAVISIDDGESLRFRADGLVFESRLLATGKWSIGIVDVRTTTYELADRLDDEVDRRDSVVSALKGLAKKFASD
jgi:hypothetical protein